MLLGGNDVVLRWNIGEMEGFLGEMLVKWGASAAREEQNVERIIT